MSPNTEDPFAAYYFEHEQQELCGQAVSAITEEFVDNYPSVVDRFFTRYYYIKPGNDAAPYQVLFHSNRICLICLAPQHPAFKSKITELNFDIGNADRSKNAVKGKGKKGGMALQADSTLALLSTEDGKVYKVPSCIRGKLIEVNMEMSQKPERLNTAPEGEGFLAIVLPKPEHCDEIKASLLNQQQYEEYLTKMSCKMEENKDANAVES